MRLPNFINGVAAQERRERVEVMVANINSYLGSIGVSQSFGEPDETAALHRSENPAHPEGGEV